MMTDTMSSLSVSGQLSKKDVKRLTNALRGSSIGPTTLYYAGVTAPVIGGGMALLTSTAFAQTSMSGYWQAMLSAIVAAMAGIVWYIIFMRWSYRHRHGRAGEMDQASEITLADACISIRRGKVETRIDWSALTEVTDKPGYIMMRFDGADPLIVPAKWFGKDKTVRQSFMDRLEKGKA